jgi:tetratricopeptide (TPR) repeat protein
MIQAQPKASEPPPASLTTRYHAFISYAHEDKTTVEWIRKLLSVFWVPWKRSRRIFLDQESLRAGGGLSGTLRDALNGSRFLIVCCSKDSAESNWVNLEVNEFLETHPLENVLACLVGPKSSGPFTVPQAIQSVQDKLGDDLFKPDLRGYPEKLKGPERRAATREALSLLAPLVGLPGKDELLDRRKKNLIFGAATLFVFICSAISWKLWDDRPQSQINKIMAQSSDLVKAVSNDVNSSKSAPPRASSIADDTQQRHLVVDEWLRTLVLTGHSNDALAAARKIERADARFHAMIEIAEQLGEGGGIRNYIDHWGQPSWEAVPDRSTERAKVDTSNEAEQASNEAVRAANEVVEAARKIEDAGARFEVMIRVAHALAKVGNGVEAKLVGHEALEAARKLEDAGSRSQQLVRVIETLTNTGQDDSATQIAAEAVQAARLVRNSASQSAALVGVTGALAKAGKTIEAQDIARTIEDSDSRASAMVSIMEALVKGGRYAEASTVARQIEKQDERAKALATVITAQAKSGKSDEAAQPINEMLTVARQLKVDAQSGYAANAWVIEALVEAARIDQALDMARQARNADDRSRALGWIVGALVKAGRHAEASRVANEAVEAARQIQGPNNRARALINIGEALAKSDGSAELGQIANEALTTINERDNYWQLSSIVQMLTKAGKNEEAKQVADRQLAAIQKLPAGKARTDALGSLDILSWATRSGASAETRQVAHAVLEAAQQRKFEWEANRAVFLVNIVGALAQTGKSDVAIEAAGEITNQVTRIQALVRSAEELAKAGDTKTASSVINEAQRLAQGLTIVKDKSFALSEVAKGLARLSDFRLARQAVQSEASSSDKLTAYIVIMREYAIEQDPSLAKFFLAGKP